MIMMIAIESHDHDDIIVLLIKTILLGKKNMVKLQTSSLVKE